MGRENRVVRLDNGVSHGRCRVHAELELGLLAIVRREALQDQRTETRAGSTTKRVEDKEALQAIAIVGQAANPVHDNVNLLLANGVVTTSVYTASDEGIEATQRQVLTVAGGIFPARHKSLGMKETPVGTIPHLVDNIGLKVNVERPRHMLAGGGLGEEGAEAIIMVRRGALQKATVGLIEC